MVMTENKSNGSKTPLVPIQLIVGLGNPGEKYQNTRHNAGAWWVEKLAGTSLKPESKFHGRYHKFSLGNHSCHLLIPTTFMNRSGQAVQAIMQYYKIPPTALLVAHDELDLPVGEVRLKLGGGHGGHNGLRDIFACLQTPDFYRLRIGIGHPGHRDRVTSYLLSPISQAERTEIEQAFDTVTPLLPELLAGNSQWVMQQLHTKRVS